MTDWSQALCARMDRAVADKLFFTKSTAGIEKAKAICSWCPVRDACLAEVLRVEGPSQTYWVRGGHSADGRRNLHAAKPEPELGYDATAVAAILAGSWRMECSRAEKEEACRRWLESGRSGAELERLTGWNVQRYVNPEYAERHRERGRENRRQHRKNSDRPPVPCPQCGAAASGPCRTRSGAPTYAHKARWDAARTDVAA